MEIAEVYTDLVNASLFVDALEQLPKARVQKLGEWKPFEDDLAEGSGAWLPLCVRKIRYDHYVEVYVFIGYIVDV